MPFDIVDRLITQFSMPGETVYDPFGGLMTVPYCAVKLGRRGVGVELNPAYFRDGAAYVVAAAEKHSVPTLFDLLTDEESAPAADLDMLGGGAA
jgi:DNA methylase